MKMARRVSLGRMDSGRISDDREVTQWWYYRKGLLRLLCRLDLTRERLVELDVQTDSVI